MSRPAVVTVTSFPTLYSAWEKLDRDVRGSRRNTKGIDGVSVNQFASQADFRLRHLSRDLRDRTFKFQPLRACLIPKPNSDKLRVICVPTVETRIAQRALLEHLSEPDRCRLVNSVSYGFIRGRTVRKAVEEAKRMRLLHQWVYKTDIQSFFDQINRTILVGRIKEAVRETSLQRLLIEAMNCEIDEPKRARRERILRQGIKASIGVRQGMPLSPFFANLILSPFDRAIEKRKISAIRYADDLIFFADNEEECRDIHSFCVHFLAKLGLSVPPIGTGKSVVYEPKEDAEFLGLGLAFVGTGYSLRVMPKQLEKIEREILRFSSLKELNSSGITISKLGIKIDSTVDGYLNAYEYADNYNQLENAIRARKRTAISNLLVSIGVMPQSLSEEARIFLELDQPVDVGFEGSS